MLVIPTEHRKTILFLPSSTILPNLPAAGTPPIGTGIAQNLGLRIFELVNMLSPIDWRKKMYYLIRHIVAIWSWTIQNHFSILYLFHFHYYLWSIKYHLWSISLLHLIIMELSYSEIVNSVESYFVNMKMKSQKVQLDQLVNEIGIQIHFSQFWLLISFFFFVPGKLFYSWMFSFSL